MFHHAIDAWLTRVLADSLCGRVGSDVLPAPEPGTCVAISYTRRMGCWECRLSLTLECDASRRAAPTSEELRKAYQERYPWLGLTDHMYYDSGLDSWRMTYVCRWEQRGLQLHLELDTMRMVAGDPEVESE